MIFLYIYFILNIEYYYQNKIYLYILDKYVDLKYNKRIN